MSGWQWRCRECPAKGEATTQDEATHHVWLHMDMAGHQDMDLDSFVDPDPVGWWVVAGLIVAAVAFLGWWM